MNTVAHEVVLIPFELIDEPPFPMRASMADLPMNELVESIRMIGIEVPLKVRPVGERYEIVAGHRRYTAAKILGLRELPCVVEVMDDLTAVMKMLGENTGREEPSAAEEGWFYLELVSRFKVNESQLCTIVKKKPEYVNDRIELVRTDPEVALANSEGKITYSVAKELLRVNHYTAALVLHVDPATIPEEDRQRYVRSRRSLLDLCVRGGATGKVARSYVEQWKAGLIPMQPFAPAPVAGDDAPPPAALMPRCLVCGRDADPQNLLTLRVHFYEKDGLLKILRSAGIECYE